jgi:hypothetical protein
MVESAGSEASGFTCLHSILGMKESRKVDKKSVMNDLDPVIVFAY